MDEPEDERSNDLHILASENPSLENNNNPSTLLASANFTKGGDAMPKPTTHKHPSPLPVKSLPGPKLTDETLVCRAKNVNFPMVRYLFTDFRALNILRNESTCTVVNEEAEISGYEIYLVEQWACDRRIVTVITSYTGDSEHKIRVGVLSIPQDPKHWSDKTRAYFNEMRNCHAKPKQTELGSLFVTSLPTFPSHLTIILVPKGDIRANAGLFDVNLNLKRMGCCGRSTVSFKVPPDAVSVKFRHMFLTSDQVPITFAARELVMIIQLSLYYFGYFQANYIDGLLCDHTQRAIKEWWENVGKQRYFLKPTEDPMCRQSVAGIIGLVMGASRRLALVSNSRAPKDPYDAEHFMYSLEIFQKNEHLPNTICLDSKTIERLHAITAKSFNNDMFEILKGTMKEVSGKKHQRLADTETSDMAQLVQYLHGDRAKYLWMGVGRMRTISTTYGQDYLGIPIAALSHSGFNHKRPHRSRRSVFRSVADHKSKTDGAIRNSVQKIKNLQYRGRYAASDSINNLDMLHHHDYTDVHPSNGVLEEYPRSLSAFLKLNGSSGVKSKRARSSSRGAHHIFRGRSNFYSSKLTGEDSGKETDDALTIELNGGDSPPSLADLTEFDDKSLVIDDREKKDKIHGYETFNSDGYDDDYYDYYNGDYDDYYDDTRGGGDEDNEGLPMVHDDGVFYSDLEGDLDDGEYYSDEYLRTDDSENSNDYRDFRHQSDLNGSQRTTNYRGYDGDVDNDYIDDDAVDYFDSNYGALGSFIVPNGDVNGSERVSPSGAPRQRRRWFGDINLSHGIRRCNSTSKLLEDIYPKSDNNFKSNGIEQIRYRGSFSLVDDRILRWYVPFDEPIERIVSKIENSKRMYACFMMQTAQISQTCQILDSQTEASIETQQINQEVLNKLNHQIQDIYNSRTRHKNELKEIDILGSKLNYQTRMLTHKIREVEGSVDMFVSKVTILENRMIQISKARGRLQAQVNPKNDDNNDEKDEKDEKDNPSLAIEKSQSAVDIKWETSSNDIGGLWARLRSYFSVFSDDNFTCR